MTIQEIKLCSQLSEAHRRIYNQLRGAIEKRIINFTTMNIRYSASHSEKCLLFPTDARIQLDIFRMMQMGYDGETIVVFATARGDDYQTADDYHRLFYFNRRPGRRVPRDATHSPKIRLVVHSYNRPSDLLPEHQDRAPGRDGEG